MAPVTVTSSCVFFSFKQETLALAVKMPRPCLASLCFVLLRFLHFHGRFFQQKSHLGRPARGTWCFRV